VLPGEAAVRQVLDLPAHQAAAAGRGLLDSPDDVKDLVVAMAEACRKRFGSDYALSVGPFPKPDSGAPEPKPLFLALATAEGTTAKSTPFAAHPALLKVLAAKQALNMVRLAMMK
jgi:nicotinamide mononucleotide (NMN) deamidase PncC